MTSGGDDASSRMPFRKHPCSPDRVPGIPVRSEIGRGNGNDRQTGAGRNHRRPWFARRLPGWCNRTGFRSNCRISPQKTVSVHASLPAAEGWNLSSIARFPACSGRPHQVDGKCGGFRRRRDRPWFVKTFFPEDIRESASRRKLPVPSFRDP